MKTAAGKAQTIGSLLRWGKAERNEEEGEKKGRRRRAKKGRRITMKEKGKGKESASEEQKDSKQRGLSVGTILIGADVN